VNYPGLESHPQHLLAVRQMRAFGGLLSFELAGGYEAAERVVAALRLITHAPSLGSVDSLIVHPAMMWRHSLTDEQLREAGVSPGLLRLSVGVEDQRDLIADLEQALLRS